jgi:hypothetical protein
MMAHMAQFLINRKGKGLKADFHEKTLKTKQNFSK